jgi:hypothetical protein
MLPVLRFDPGGRTYARLTRKAVMLGRGGFGLISTSNFYVPQVNLSGSMAAFVQAAAIPCFCSPAREDRFGAIRYWRCCG